MLGTGPEKCAQAEQQLLKRCRGLAQPDLPYATRSVSFLHRISSAHELHGQANLPHTLQHAAGSWLQMPIVPIAWFLDWGCLPWSLLSPLQPVPIMTTAGPSVQATENEVQDSLIAYLKGSIGE